MVSVLESGTAKRRISSQVDRHRVFYRLVFSGFAIALVVVLFLVLRGGDRRSFAFGPSIRSPDLGASVVAGLGSTPGRVAPVLAREAERIAASDATLARLLRLGDGRRVGHVSPWFVGKDRRGGALLAYRLKRPIAVDSDLPYVAIPPDAPAHGTCITPYAPGWAHLRAPEVTRLSALVDLRRNRVVEIGTNANRGRIGPVAGEAYPTCDEDQAG